MQNAKVFRVVGGKKTKREKNEEQRAPATVVLPVEIHLDKVRNSEEHLDEVSNFSSPHARTTCGWPIETATSTRRAPGHATALSHNLSYSGGFSRFVLFVRAPWKRESR